MYMQRLPRGIVTARIRRMTGGYIFTLCVSPHLSGLPTFQVGWVPTFPGLDGGVPTFPGGEVPTLARYLPT